MDLRTELLQNVSGCPLMRSLLIESGEFDGTVQRGCDVGMDPIVTRGVGRPGKRCGTTRCFSSVERLESPLASLVRYAASLSSSLAVYSDPAVPHIHPCTCYPSSLTSWSTC